MKRPPCVDKMRFCIILTHQTQGFALGCVKKGLIRELARHVEQMDMCIYAYKWEGKVVH